MSAPGLRVTQSERRRLQRIAHSEREKRATRRRALVVLMSHAGHSGREIADVLGITRRTVSNTRRRWRERGLEGLAAVPSPGRPPLADAAYVRRLLRVVERDPRTLGYAFARWTAPRLAAYMAEETGIEITAGWLAEILKAHGYVWRRTKRTTRNLHDPAAVSRARRRLLALKKGRNSPTRTSSSGSPTASDSSSCP
ncbi:MAG: helix-turn-helix domain-containing protein [Planctomycetota bacterium]|jgi:transposase